MTRYEIRRYENATWNAETENWDLGAPAETVGVIEAESPSAARNLAEATVDATRTETSTRRIRGRVEQLTTYLTTSDALMAWRVANGIMALVYAGPTTQQRLVAIRARNVAAGYRELARLLPGNIYNAAARAERADVICSDLYKLAAVCVDNDEPNHDMAVREIGLVTEATADQCRTRAAAWDALADSIDDCSEVMVPYKPHDD